MENEKMHKNHITKQRKESFALTACSDAPMYLFNSSGPLTDIKRSEQAAAAAPTMCVFPHPGGP